MNWRFWERKKPEPVEPEPAPQPEPAPAPTPGMFQAEPVNAPAPEPEPGNDDGRMDPHIKARWVAALRSGNYIQGEGRLKQRRDHEKSKYCCLGVLCEIAVQDGVIKPPEKIEDEGFPGSAYKYEGDKFSLGPRVQEWAGIESNPAVKDPNGHWSSLADMNDDGASFEEIADVIERQL